MIQITHLDGTPEWLNPDLIYSIRPHGNEGHACVRTMAARTYHAVICKESPRDVVDMINASRAVGVSFARLDVNGDVEMVS